MKTSLTNEELAELIKNGDDGYIPQLWEQVRKFIMKMAYAYYDRHPDIRGIEIDDLIQQGYFAVVNAVNYYKPDLDYKFTTYLSRTLQTAFNELSGKRNSRGLSNDALEQTISLDEIKYSESDTTLLDTIADETDIESDVCESDYNYHLRQVLNAALAELSEKKNNMITLYYFFGLSMSDISKAMDCSRTLVGKQIEAALHSMRTGPYRKQLYEFMYPNKEFNYYGTGYNAWKTSMGVEERFLILREVKSDERRN